MLTTGSHRIVQLKRCYLLELAKQLKSSLDRLIIDELARNEKAILVAHL
jgi:hypothetical protein